MPWSSQGLTEKRPEPAGRYFACLVISYWTGTSYWPGWPDRARTGSGSGRSGIEGSRLTQQASDVIAARPGKRRKKARRHRKWACRRPRPPGSSPRRELGQLCLAHGLVGGGAGRNRQVEQIAALVD